MPAAITDKFAKVISGTTRPVATTLASQKTSGATSASVVATTGWDTSTAVHGIMYRVDASNVKVPGSQIDWKGTISGTTINDFTVTAGSDDTYEVGTVVELSPTAAWGDDMATGLVVEHNQDGTHATNMTVNTNNATLTSPKVITGVNDTNGNELLKVTATGSAVNELTLANAATGNAPVISATGGDTNIGITLTPKGTGKVTIADSTNLGGAWQTWTPTLTNMTLGNGTVTAKYIQIGKTVFFRFAFVFGSTSTMGSIPRFSLPVTAASHAGSLGSILLGTANAYDNATNNFDCVAVLNSTTDAIIRVIQASGTNSLQANITSTNPMTWTTSDELHVIGQYEAA